MEKIVMVISHQQPIDFHFFIVCICDFYSMNKMSVWQLQSESEFDYSHSSRPTSPNCLGD